MKPSKKNTVFMYVCSIIPGAAEMYTGLFKLGFSIMLVFVICLAGISLSGLRFIFGALAVLVWFLSFFYTLNIMRSDDDDFRYMKDDFVWNILAGREGGSYSPESMKKLTLAAVIIFAVLVLWGSITGMFSEMMPDSVWSVFHPFFSRIPQIIIAFIVIIAACRSYRKISSGNSGMSSGYFDDDSYEDVYDEVYDEVYSADESGSEAAGGFRGGRYIDMPEEVTDYTENGRPFDFQWTLRDDEDFEECNEKCGEELSEEYDEGCNENCSEEFSDECSPEENDSDDAEPYNDEESYNVGSDEIPALNDKIKEALQKLRNAVNAADAGETDEDVEQIIDFARDTIAEADAAGIKVSDDEDYVDCPVIEDDETEVHADEPVRERPAPDIKEGIKIPGLYKDPDADSKRFFGKFRSDK